MKRLFSTIFFLIFLGLIVFSQPSAPGSAPKYDNPTMTKSGIIRGKIIEQGSNVPLEYANVAIYSQRDSSLAGGGIADPNGNFQVPNLKPGIYYLEAKFIGYEKLLKQNINVGRDKLDVDLGKIELEPASENLNEVNVYSQNKPIIYGIDKKIVDPAQFPTASNGTAVDVLANTPAVSVDIEGNVSLRGSANFTVLVDGRPTPFSAADALEQIPASTIRNIEIITNPSAKYDPDGNAGIININTKKSKMNGISGIANASGDSNGSISGDFLLNYKTGKFNFYVSGNKSNRHGNGRAESTNITYDVDTVTTTSSGDNERGHDSWSVKGGLDYFINDKNTLSFSAALNQRSRIRAGTNIFKESSTNGFLLNTITESNNEGKGRNFSFDLNYKKTFSKAGEELTVYAYYEKGYDNELSYYDRFISDTVLYGGQKNWENGDGREIRFKADYILPINDKMKLEAGYQARIDHNFDWNDVHWYSVADDYQPSETSQYYTNSNFDRNIHSLYVTWNNSGSFFGYQLGFRTEYTDRSISYTGSSQDYVINRWDFFPSAHISANISAKQQVTASYTRRIQRPRGWFLEPFMTYTDAYNIRQGNPGIQPEYINSYELGYQLQLKKGFVSAELYRREINNHIEPVKSVYSETVMLQTFENVGKDYSTGVELMLNYKPTKWWMFNLMGNLYRYRITGDLYGSSIDQSSTNWNARFNNTFTITKTTKLQIDGMYNSPTTSAQGRRDGFAFTNMAVRQDLFENKLNVTFSIRDVLNTAKFGFMSSGPGFYSSSKFDMKSPVFSLTLSYKINNYKQKQKFNNENGQSNEMMDMENAEGMGE